MPVSVLWHGTLLEQLQLYGTCALSYPQFMICNKTGSLRVRLQLLNA